MDCESVCCGFRFLFILPLCFSFFSAPHSHVRGMRSVDIKARQKLSHPLQWEHSSYPIAHRAGGCLGVSEEGGPGAAACTWLATDVAAKTSVPVLAGAYATAAGSQGL